MAIKRRPVPTSGETMSFSSVRIWLVACAVTSLAACGDGSFLESGGGGGGGGGDGGGTTEPPTVSMSLEADLTSLSAAGSTGLTIRFVDQNDAPFTGSANVTFSSTCVGNGTASITTATAVPTTTGTIQATYADRGCGQTDTVTATGTANGQTFTATVNISVAAASIGSIQFISATPALIGIRGGGSGLPEQSAVVFRVLNTASGPAAGRSVTFTLNNTAGGIEFSNGATSLTALSGADGSVQAVVRSGTVLTSVRVTATYTDPDSGAVLSTQSSGLTISTGFPDNDSFSLSASNINVHGLDFDGTRVTITARLSDRNNNPVPDGTAVAFTTEGGDIESTCFTTDGACAVIWESQNPRPPEHDPACATTLPGFAGNDLACANGQRAGRTAVLAYAVGEESFTDLNGNGLFDGADPFFDLPEAFQDYDEDGVRDAAFEPFVDFGGTPNGTYDAADTDYNGQLCEDTSGRCASQTTLHVRRSIVLVMAGSGPVIDLATDVAVDGVVGDITIDFVGKNDVVSFDIVLRDVNDQPLPSGLGITATTDVGSVIFGASQSVPITSDDSIAGNTYNFTLKGPAGTEPDAGLFVIEIQRSVGASVKVGFDVSYTP